ncbi:MAG: hypothetical protein BAJATHORv1_80068 [Candidatus Thorarchaeota archaeon]|nr:MAG: hypothetical protein BAJATHORv1_80068 [Candidatus Thorarchaeota archaeon]
MVFIISEEDVPKLEEVVEDYVRNHHDQSLTLERVISYLEQALSSERVCVLAHKTKGIVDGFILTQNHGEISAYHVKADDDEKRKEIESLLFEGVIEKLKNSVETITYSDSKGISSLKFIFDKAEFESYDRASMYVAREDIRLPDDLELSEEYQVTNFSNEMIEDLAKIVYDANKGQIDSRIYYKYFGSKGNAIEFVKKFSNDTFGRHIEEIAKVVLSQSKPVAVCFMSLASEKTAAVVELAVESKHKKQGLGTKVLIESIKASFAIPKVQEIGLHVTLSNPAKKIYDKLGFKERYRYTIYVKHFNK